MNSQPNVLEVTSLEDCFMITSMTFVLKKIIPHKNHGMSPGKNVGIFLIALSEAIVCSGCNKRYKRKKANQAVTY